MAKSLDDLIEFLLEQIAISGSRGLSVNEIADFATSFYNTTDNQNELHKPDDASATNVTVDRRLLERIWTWLGRLSDVSIGEYKQYNQTSLGQVVLQFPGYLHATFDKTTQPVDKLPDDASPENASENPKAKQGKHRTRPVEGPRFHVSEERVYQAICGHLPDIAKVGPLEFDLLSHIAVTRSDGILQGELVRASGQDKRSVPKRTDALQRKGYILKEIVYQRGTRTSRLILKKFAASSGTSGDHAERKSTIRDAVRRVFEVLSDRPLVPQKAIAEALNLESPAELAVLVKIIRRLERLKCVKRVRTATGPSATSGDLQNYVQILRPLEPEDMENFDTDTLCMDQTIEHLSARSESESQVDPPTPAGISEDQTEEEQTRRHLARWNPDRLMPNAVHDAACLAGHEGLTNTTSRQLITGLFVQRTMESLLMRVSCKSLVVQPSHIRHLAIVRTVAVNDGVTQYIHYPWQTFCELVDEKGLDISQIPGAKQALNSRHQGRSGIVSDQEPSEGRDTNEFGFPPQGSIPLQVRNGEVDFSTLLGSVAAGDFMPRIGETIVVKQADGSFAISLRENMPGKAGSLLIRQQPRPQTPRTPKRAVRNSPGVEIVKGRPRKYMRGTESFWRRVFKQVRTDSGIPPTIGWAGIMNDPGGLDLYARRPVNFDETLLEAIAAGLPEPHFPEHINDAWITSTKEILNRSSDGLYITPRGLRHDSAKQKSQIVIMRSSRLSEVDLYDRTQVHPFRLISSSAAHSFAYRRYYPSPPVGQSSTKITDNASADKIKSPKKRAKSIGKPGPPVGVFYEERPPAEPSTAESHAHHETVIALDTHMDTTDEELEPPPNTDQPSTSVSLNSAIRPLAPNQVQSIQGLAKETTHGAEHASERSRATPSAKRPRSPSVTITDLARPSRKRKLTHKAVELLDSSGDHDSPLLLGPSIPQGDSTSEATEHHLASGDQGQIQPLAQEAPTKQETPEEDRVPRLFVEIPPRAAEPHTEDERTLPTTNQGWRGEQRIVAQQPPATLTEPVQEPSSAHPTVSRVQPIPQVQHNSSITQPEEPFVSVETKGNAQATAIPEESTRKKIVTRTKRRREDLSSDSEAPATPEKRGKRSDHQRANALCRKIVLQLVSETSGVVPNDASTIRRISAPRWQEAGQEDRPQLKAIKANIKSLCEQRKLRQVMFTFRGKNGMMLKRAVLFLPNISPESPLVQETKQKIIDNQPADYIPPEWIDEGNRVPLVGKKQQATISDDEDTPSKRRRTSTAASKVSGRTPRTPRGQRWSLATSVTPIEDLTMPPNTRSMSRVSTPPPAAETAATGFLTLKVPRIGTLPSVQIYNWRTETPVTALRFETAAPNPPNSTSVTASRRGRKPRKPANRPPGRTVVWAGSNSQSFPSSLNDILDLPNLKVPFEHVQSDDSEWQRFACEVEGVRAWEEQETEAATANRSKYAFINHTVPGALYAEASSPETTTFAGLVQFDQDGDGSVLPHPSPESWPVFASALRAAPEQMERIAGAAPDEATATPDSEMPPPVGNEPAVRRSGRAPRRKAVVDEFGFGPHPKRQKRGTRTPRATPGRRTLTAATVTPTRLTRAPQILRAMPEGAIYRIVVSVVVVRTLAGGIQSNIDWPLVMTMFPDQDEEFVQARWKTLAKRYAHDINGLTESLQFKYLDALEKDEVPSVNLEDLKATDWPGIVDWALQKLDRFDTKEVDDLPATQEEVLYTNTLTFFEPRPYHSVLGYGALLTNPVKEDLVASLPFAGAQKATIETDLHYRPSFELAMSDPKLHLAKSWVFATVLTPEDGFDPILAQAKLSSLASEPGECEDLVHRALKVLQDEKLVQRAHKERHSTQLASLRTWEGSRRLYERFEERRSINAQMLQRAARYKVDVLDPAFAKGESVPFENDGIVDDGVMVAVLNLMAMGMVRAKPGADVPRTRYGLEWEKNGYQTKKMDKKVLNFGVDIVPTSAYVPDDPKFGDRKIPVPRGGADEPDGLMPPWVDIHGSVQTGLWEMFLGGVIGLVSQLPGISALEISRALTFALDEGGVESIMDWCVAAGFAKVDGISGGFETTEWWWLCISRGSDDGWVWNA
ncbi:hypothetical protein EDD36DRAFT_311436 [Exophiala viscosa]|uniref:B-block binding subunit of TFIIIC domain-containing protein n=1 Tax=Exophiala viscosa TaxID=2486360 RepID=A0AAN6DQW6_9EURO|nr:hypothetical protein EDD36DRAFT_311436 [Exophiala viscosa]